MEFHKYKAQRTIEKAPPEWDGVTMIFPLGWRELLALIRGKCINFKGDIVQFSVIRELDNGTES